MWDSVCSPVRFEDSESGKDRAKFGLFCDLPIWQMRSDDKAAL